MINRSQLIKTGVYWGGLLCSIMLLMSPNLAQAISCDSRLNRLLLPYMETLARGDESLPRANRPLSSSAFKASLVRHNARSAMIRVDKISDTSTSTLPAVMQLRIDKGQFTVTEVSSTPHAGYVSHETNVIASPSRDQIDALNPARIRDYVLLCLSNKPQAEAEEQLLLQEMFLGGAYTQVERSVLQDYDLSLLLAEVNKDQAIGIIGEYYKRLMVNLDSVDKIKSQDYQYQLTGQSKVGRGYNDFKGTMTLEAVYVAQQPSYGIDDSYKEVINQQGVAVFRYQLNEDPKQANSGVFTGKLYSKWYTSHFDHQLHRDDIDAHYDSYYNNVFNGQWRSYRSDATSKPAIWSLYKSSDVLLPDLNVGAGEFVINPRYAHLGWEKPR